MFDYEKISLKRSLREIKDDCQLFSNWVDFVLRNLKWVLFLLIFLIFSLILYYVINIMCIFALEKQGRLLQQRARSTLHPVAKLTTIL